MTYRIIHKRNTVNALFKPHEEDVQLASPDFGGEYDFSGFKRYKATLDRSAKHLFWDIKLPDPTFSAAFTTNPALQRVIGDAPGSAPVIEEDARRGGGSNPFSFHFLRLASSFCLLSAS